MNSFGCFGVLIGSLTPEAPSAMLLCKLMKITLHHSIGNADAFLMLDSATIMQYLFETSCQV